MRLVGPTISCEGSPYQGNVQGEWRTNPHVQSYVLATDQVGCPDAKRVAGPKRSPAYFSFFEGQQAENDEHRMIFGTFAVLQ